MQTPFSPAEWLTYYSQKRIVHQWTQLDMLSGVAARRVLEVGPARGLVTAMLANAGYEVETLDREPRAFVWPATRHIEADIQALSGGEIAGYDAILCCETLEHIDWDEVAGVLRAFRASGARYLVVSVPYMAFQVTFDLYLNAWTLRHYFSLKKLLHRREFAREPPGGHQWEVGYRGYPLARWEALQRECGWKIVRREFTAHTRSVFHLLEAA
jgi:hypothetical protein